MFQVQFTSAKLPRLPATGTSQWPAVGTVNHMSEVSERYGRVADGFGRRLSGVETDQWSSPTPCTDWDVRDLVHHVLATHARVAASLSEEPAVDPDKEGDLVSLWPPARAAISDALEDPDRASQTIGGMFGEQPFESLVGRLLCADTLFHTWDLARATGQDEQLDAESVLKTMEFLQPIDDAIRRPGGFAPKLLPPQGADAQTQMLCFGGRPS